MQYENILKKLKALSNPKAVEGMTRFGISPENTYGVSVPNLRKMAKEIGRDHSLDKESLDKKFLVLLPAIKREADDDRNYVKKAVNWALRNIGKRNLNLNKKAIETAKEIQKMDSRSAKWIASDAIRELMSEAVQERLQKRCE